MQCHNHHVYKGQKNVTNCKTDTDRIKSIAVHVTVTQIQQKQPNRKIKKSAVLIFDVNIELLVYMKRYEVFFDTNWMGIE